MTTLAALLLYALVVAAAEAIPAVRAARTRRYLPRDQRDDTTNAELNEWADLLEDMRKQPPRPLDEAPLPIGARARALYLPTGEYPIVQPHTYGRRLRQKPAPVRWARWQTPSEGMPLVLTGQGVVR